MTVIQRKQYIVSNTICHMVGFRIQNTAKALQQEGKTILGTVEI